MSFQLYAKLFIKETESVGAKHSLRHSKKKLFLGIECFAPTGRGRNFGKRDDRFSVFVVTGLAKAGISGDNGPGHKNGFLRYFDAQTSLYDTWLLRGRNQPVLAGYSQPVNFKSSLPLMFVCKLKINIGMLDDAIMYSLA